MKNAVDVARASRARKVRFLMPDGSKLVVPPITIDQAIDCLSLDPEPGSKEAPLEKLVRLRAQAQVLLGPEHAHLVGSLDEWQVSEVASAIYISASGLDAEAYIAWLRGQREAGIVTTSAELLESLEKLSLDLAGRLSVALSEVDGMAVADAVSLREELVRVEKARADLQSIIVNGKPLAWKG